MDTKACPGHRCFFLLYTAVYLVLNIFRLLDFCKEYSCQTKGVERGGGGFVDGGVGGAGVSHVYNI